jgi:hypothetical protein
VSDDRGRTLDEIEESVGLQWLIETSLDLTLQVVAPMPA